MKACVTYAKRGINLITMNLTFMARSKVQNLQISTDILFFFFQVQRCRHRVANPSDSY